MVGMLARRAFQWIIVMGEECEPVIVFDTLDLSVHQRVDES